MGTYEITTEMNPKKTIDESREALSLLIAQALNELGDNLERIEKEYVESQNRK